MTEYDHAEVHRYSISVKDLMLVKSHSEIRLKKHMPKAFEDHNRQTWNVVATSDRPVIIKHPNGEILFLKPQLDPKLADMLEKSDSYLNPCSKGLDDQ